MMARTPPDIFLSYSRTDLAIAGPMAAALKAAGHDVWWDQALKAGEVYDKVTETALLEARVVVVLWSKASVASDWVRAEATVALQRNALVPVMIEDCRRPVMFELRQSADLTGWKGSAKDPRLAAFLSDVARQLAAPPVTGTATKSMAATAPKPGPNRRVLIGGAAGAVALAAGGFGAWKFMGSKADDGTASVVVLPFANLSGDPAQAFFSDGIAEELRNALAQIRGLKVIGRVSSEQFRDTGDLLAAAAKLGVDHVLTGSVRRSPTTIRIGAQLVDGRTGVESWSQSYDQPVGDALAIQSKIATSVVAALSAKLGKAAGQIIVGSTANAKAQELYLKASTQYAYDRSEAGYRQVLAMLDSATTIDPGYADAWALMGTAKSSLRNYPGTQAAQLQLGNEAIAANQRAVALAPNSAFVRVLLARRYVDALDIRRALAEIERAIALDSSEGRVLSSAATTLRLFSPDRAVALAEKALSLDPINADFIANYGAALQSARRYKEAVVVGQKAMLLSKNGRGSDGLVHSWLGLGQVDAARTNLQYLPFTAMRLAFTAIVEARAGDLAASDAAMAALRKVDDVSINYRLASAHAQRGEKDAALGALESALKLREGNLAQIVTDPWFDPIRSDPRVKAVQDAVIPPDLIVPPKQAIKTAVVPA